MAYHDRYADDFDPVQPTGENHSVGPVASSTAEQRAEWLSEVTALVENAA